MLSHFDGKQGRNIWHTLSKNNFYIVHIVLYLVHTEYILCRYSFPFIKKNLDQYNCNLLEPHKQYNLAVVYYIAVSWRSRTFFVVITAQ